VLNEVRLILPRHTPNFVLPAYLRSRFVRRLIIMVKRGKCGWLFCRIQRCFLSWLV